MTLDTAIQIFQQVETYEEYAEGLLLVLQRCHTREELENVMLAISFESVRRMKA